MAAQPHFVQVGDSPVLVGDGTESLACTCGQSVLVANYRPGTVLGIGMQCSRCGAVTETPGLAPGQVLPARLRVIAASATGVLAPPTLPPGLTLAGEAEVARVDALTRPVDPPTEPQAIDADLLAKTAADYDRLTGSLEAHREAVLRRSNPTAWMPHYPLAWALTWLQGQVGRPGWTWYSSDPDGMATALVLAFRQFQACWSQHPLFPAMVASAAADGFSFHALALFAGARALVQSGNRVSFVPPASGARIDGFAIGPAGSDGLHATVQRLGRFEWPGGRPGEPAAIRATVVDAIAAVQGRLNLRRPGVLILSPGGVPGTFDQPLIDAMTAALRAQGRRYRGVTAVAAVLPKLDAVPGDRAIFAWPFFPVSNPHPAPDVAARIGRREDFADLGGRLA